MKIRYVILKRQSYIVKNGNHVVFENSNYSISNLKCMNELCLIGLILLEGKFGYWESDYPILILMTSVYMP